MPTRFKSLKQVETDCLTKQNKSKKSNESKLYNKTNCMNNNIITNKAEKERINSYTVYNTITEYSFLSKYRHKVKIITNICLIFILMLVIFSIAVLSTDKNKINSSFLGYKFFQANTTSMYPYYNPNDLLVVKEVDESKIDVNDVIVYNQDNSFQTYLIRRVTEKINNYQQTGHIGFKTKSDAYYDESSAIVTSNQIYGVVQYRIAFLGVMAKTIKDDTLFISSIIVLLTILCLLLRLLFGLNNNK